MTAMAMQRRKDGKRSAPREKATGKKRDNGEREKKRQREGHGQKQRGGERGRPRHRDGKRGGCCADEGGRRMDSPPAPPGGITARRGPRDGPSGRGRAGPGRGRAGARGSRTERGKEGPGGLREGEGSRGAGRARGAGRKRGGAAGRGPPEKRPNFLPRQSQEAGAGTQGPGSPSPTSGAPPVTSPHGHQVLCPWPRPASSPLPGEVGGGGRGLGRCRQWRGLLGAPLSQTLPLPGPQFSHLSKGTKRDPIPEEWPVGGVRRARPGTRPPTVHGDG